MDQFKNKIVRGLKHDLKKINMRKPDHEQFYFVYFYATMMSKSDINVDVLTHKEQTKFFKIMDILLVSKTEEELNAIVKERLLKGGGENCPNKDSVLSVFS